MVGETSSDWPRGLQSSEPSQARGRFFGGGSTIDERRPKMSSFTINRVVLIGRLTKDPELRVLPSGLCVCNLRVACNSARRDTEGEYQDKPNFFDVSAFGGTAESVNRYTQRG